MLAPVVYFAFNRPDLVRRSLASLLAQPSIQQRLIYVVIDGPRETHPAENDKVAEVQRIVVEMLRDHHEARFYARPHNLGLADGIIGMLDNLFSHHPALVVLEDDLLLADGFLEFIDQALVEYRHNQTVMAVSGFSYPMTYNDDSYDVAFGRRASSWGWATWRDRWTAVDWYTPIELTREQRRAFARISSDLPRRLERQQRGEISSWCIRWVYHQFKHGLVDVFPRQTLVENVGYRSDGTNCVDDVRGWHSTFAQYTAGPWRMPKTVTLDEDVLRQIGSFNSVSARGLRVMRRFMNRIKELVA